MSLPSVAPGTDFSKNSIKDMYVASEREGASGETVGFPDFPEN